MTGSFMPRYVTASDFHWKGKFIWHCRIRSEGRETFKANYFK